MTTATSSQHCEPTHEGRVPLVELRGVSKRFATGTLAVREVDLKIRAGEFLSLLGPSGCGKTTVLRLIAGLIEASAGTIRWQQEFAQSSADALGFVFQEPTLMPWSTAIGNAMIPLRLRGKSVGEAEPMAAQMLARVGLQGFERAYPRQLSGGMKMRVSIARALVTQPRVLLMDEPFAALDEITRHQLNDDLLGLWAQNRFTVVFVTHSVFESVYLSQRVAVMAARPGRMSGEIDVDTGYPRDALYRTSPDYARLCRLTSQTLKQAMAA